jgi:hypothetical protein
MHVVGIGDLPGAHVVVKSVSEWLREARLTSAANGGE